MQDAVTSEPMSEQLAETMLFLLARTSVQDQLLSQLFSHLHQLLLNNSHLLHQHQYQSLNNSHLHQHQSLLTSLNQLLFHLHHWLRHQTTVLLHHQSLLLPHKHQMLMEHNQHQLLSLLTNKQPQPLLELTKLM
jgi:hypothetical protein